MDSPKKSNEQISRKMKRTPYRKKRKPYAKTGLLSTAVYLVDKMVNKDHLEYDENKSERQHLDTSVDILNSKLETSDNILDIGKSITATANVAEMKAGNEDIGLKTSILSASAHAEYGLNNSVGLNASLVRAEGHFGPVTIGAGLNFDCSASIGVNGIEASVLGTGISIGPKIVIKTPVADLKVNLI